jgi:hypothetical protein
LGLFFPLDAARGEELASFSTTRSTIAPRDWLPPQLASFCPIGRPRQLL